MPSLHIFLVSLLLQISTISSKTYEYGITGKSRTSIRSTNYHVAPLDEKSEKLQQLLENLGRKPKLRRLHGVRNDKTTKPIILSGGSVAGRKKKGSLIRPVTSMNIYEQELARQIEDDQLKFVEDEKNPMKYVVHDGLLYKQSRFSPLARIEVPELPKTNKHKPKKKKKLRKSAGVNSSPIRTNVFRGNINRQIPAIPIPPEFFTHSPFSINRGKEVSFGNTINHSPSDINNIDEDEKCQVNRFGFICCDAMLESLMLKSFTKLKRRDDSMNLTQIARTIKLDTRNFFHKDFETIVSYSDFGTSIPTNFHCKVGLGYNNLVAMAFIPEEADFEIIGSRKRRRDIPYHELSREDFQESADLIVSRNGVLVAEMLDITSSRK